MLSSLPFLMVLHIFGAAVGLLSGFLSMAFRKGSGLHRAAGSVFFVSMVVMTVSAAVASGFVRPNKLNFIVSLLTFYLVTTGWWASKRRDGRIGIFDRLALPFVAGVGLTAIVYGIEAMNSPTRTLDEMPGAAYLVFGVVSLLCAVTDVRMLIRGSLVGPYRLARHLWRMCLALLIATLSFYPGQAKLFPMWLRESSVVFVPHLFLVGSMLFWMVRVKFRKRVPQGGAAAGARRDTVAPRVAA